MVRRAPSGAAIRSISRKAARRPISVQGCATSVRRGSKQSAHSKSSKPTTETSFGTRNPRLRIAFMIPIVARLLPPTKAVGGSATSRSRSAACIALIVVALPVTRRSSSIATPAPARQSRKPAMRSSVVSKPGLPPTYPMRR